MTLAAAASRKGMVMSLSLSEIELGFVEWICPDDEHGFLAAAPASCTVVCGSGKRARAERGGVVLDAKARKQIAAVSRQG